MIDRAVTVLPEPDSPTMPSTSFSSTSKDTPSTAWTVPSSVGNWTCRPSTESTVARVTLGRSVGRLRVEGVAQSVAQEVHRQDGDEDGEPRKIDEVGQRRADGLSRLPDHVSPGHRGRLDAKTEERER